MEEEDELRYKGTSAVSNNTGWNDRLLALAMGFECTDLELGRSLVERETIAASI